MTDDLSRERMIRDAMKTGLSRADASVLTDVSKHAFDEAMGTAQRILDTCPDELRLAAFASVLCSFAMVMRDSLPAHWAAFLAFPARAGQGEVITLPWSDQAEEGGR